MTKIKASLIAGKVTSNSVEAQDLIASKNFGEKLSQKIFYSLPEALFLVEDKKMEVFDHQENVVSSKDLQRKFQRLDKNFLNKFIVYRDLRKRGYVVKTALRFGAEFRVYEKGKSGAKNHSKWILFPVSEYEGCSWQDFSAKNRVAHSSKKNILVAIVDEETKVSYYEVKWIKL
jgi:tRNA-intron endonuclease, archaea type